MYITNESYYEKIKKRNYFECKNNLSRFENKSIERTKPNNFSPDITIFIPTYGRSDTLIRAIKSAIQQIATNDLEIIVVDNNPENIASDTVLKLIDSFHDERIRYFCNIENLGPMGNWNCGYMLARGKWVCMLHDDDVLSPNWYVSINNTINNNINNTDIDVLCVKYSTLKQNAEVERFIQKKDKCLDGLNLKRIKNNDILKKFCSPILGSIIRKDFFYELGGFDDLTKFEDYIFMANAVSKGNVFVLDCKLYGYWISQFNDSNSVGLWDDVIIGEFYFRKSFGSIMSKTYTTIYANRQLAKSILVHNLDWVTYVNFSKIKVNKERIIAECSVGKVNYLISAILCFPELIKNQLLHSIKRIKIRG